MHLRIYLSFLAGLLSVSLAGQEPDSIAAAKAEVIWQETVSYAGRFRVKTPGYMTEKVDTIKTQLGQVPYHTFFFQSPDKQADNLFYMVSYCDYPEGSVHSDSTDMLEEFFEVSAEEAAFSIAGDLIYHEFQEWNGYPGMVWRVEYLKGAAVIKTRAFLAENRYYSVQIITLKDRSLNPSGKQFFDSFYLLDGAASGN